VRRCYFLDFSHFMKNLMILISVFFTSVFVGCAQVEHDVARKLMAEKPFNQAQVDSALSLSGDSVNINGQPLKLLGVGNTVFVRLEENYINTYKGYMGASTQIQLGENKIGKAVMINMAEIKKWEEKLHFSETENKTLLNAVVQQEVWELRNMELDSETKNVLGDYFSLKESEAFLLFRYYYVMRNFGDNPPRGYAKLLQIYMNVFIAAGIPVSGSTEADLVRSFQQIREKREEIINLYEAEMEKL
jgi:hypothetical protein